MIEWKGIETAPKDGTPILVTRWRADLGAWQSPVVMLWSDKRGSGGWVYSGLGAAPVGDPEMWTELPALPIVPR